MTISLHIRKHEYFTHFQLLVDAHRDLQQAEEVLEWCRESLIPHTWSVGWLAAGCCQIDTMNLQNGVMLKLKWADNIDKNRSGSA